MRRLLGAWLLGLALLGVLGSLARFVTGAPEALYGLLPAGLLAVVALAVWHGSGGSQPPVGAPVSLGTAPPQERPWRR